MYHFSFLASGDSFTGLKARFHTGKSTIHDVIVETCQAIWEVLKDEVLPTLHQNIGGGLKKDSELDYIFQTVLEHSMANT